MDKLSSPIEDTELLSDAFSVPESDPQHSFFTPSGHLLHFLMCCVSLVPFLDNVNPQNLHLTFIILPICSAAAASKKALALTAFRPGCEVLIITLITNHVFRIIEKHK